MKFSLSDLAALVAAEFKGDPKSEVTGVNTLDEASPSDVSFLANPKYQEKIKTSLAGVICVDPQTPLEENKNYLISKSPSEIFQKIAELFQGPREKSGFTNIHPTAVIHESATIHPTAQIGPFVVIDQNSIIGKDTTIFAHSTIYQNVTIGEECTIHSNCTIREGSILKDRVILQPGAVIGSCGFGYLPDSLGRFQKLEQIGNVILEEDVEIGSHTCIDRSRFKSTIVRRGSKIDNLCQIAHNVEVGEDNVIAAQTGIAGSAKLGKRVMLGGQVGVVGHVSVGDEVMIATRGGISKPLKKGKYRGSPAMPIDEYNRQKVHTRKLETYVQRISELEKKFEELSKSSS